MRILLSDVHGGYTDAFVAGAHDYLFLPAVDGRGGLSRLGAGETVVTVEPCERIERVGGGKLQMVVADRTTAA